MKKTYVFNGKEPLENDFFYVSSLNPTFKKTDKKFQFDDTAVNCIRNEYNEDIKDYDYISILSKKRYKSGAKMTTRCAFFGYGAPIIVIGDDVRSYENGDRYYGLHFEVVAYTKGCNVWQIIPLPEGSKEPIENRKIATFPFPIEENSLVEISIEVRDKRIVVRVNDETVVAESPDIPEAFHVGLTACEGIDRFFDFTIDAEEA